MRRVKVVLALVLSIVMVFASIPNLYADETSELILKLLVKKGLITEEEVSDMRAEIEREKRVVEKAAPGGLSERVAKLEKAKDASSWAEKIELKGDVRFRHELIWDNDAATRNRERVRARLGAYAEVNDQVDAGIRIVSGNDSPTTTNQSLNDFFESKPLMLDWAYINYEPLDWVNIKAGMFKNPFVGFMNSELLWDTDVSFAGAVVQVHHDLEDGYLPPTTLFANIGEFPLDEFAAVKEDPWLLVYQGGYKTKLTDDLKWDLAGTYYQYLDVMDLDIDHATGGNTLLGANLAKDFNILDLTSKITLKDPFKKIGIEGVDIPALILYGDIAINVEGAEENLAWMNGIKIGYPKVKDKNQWSLYYNYRHIEADSQLDVFPDADFHGGTNAEGHNIILEYGLLKNTVLAAEWYYTRNIIKTDNNDYDSRLQLDAVVKF